MQQTELSGIARQDKFIQSVKDQGFDYGLVLTQAFLKGMRI